MNTGFQFFQLQQIDSGIAESKRRILEIVKVVDDRNNLEEVEEKIRSLEKDLRNKQQQFDNLDFEIQTRKNKKAQSESMLYAGKIQNPKELQDLQLEISSLTQTILHMEDDLLEKMIALEDTQQTVVRTQEELASHQTQWEIRYSRLIGEKKELERLIANLEYKRNPIVSQIHDNVLSIYERLKTSKNGVAVGTLQEDACSCCGTSLTASQCQQARSASTLFFCPSCGRIIYGS